jgi:hypothetical protein
MLKERTNFVYLIGAGARGTDPFCSRERKISQFAVLSVDNEAPRTCQSPGRVKW